MLSLESARQQILSRLPPPSAERIPLAQAHGRVLAEAIIAPIDLPGFDNSAMDGYAVRASDLKGATPERPVPLLLTGRSSAGGTASNRVENGTCVRVFTGAPVPEGADAVVMQEDTREAEAGPGHILVLDAVKPWENIRFRGEDVKKAHPVSAPGERLTATRIGLAAALGVESVMVGRKPKVALLATGNELVEPGRMLEPGQIYESNRSLLTPLVVCAGATPVVYPLVPDTMDATESALRAAWSECDAVITSGGVSVGELDFVKPAFERLGGRMEFWRVAIKPGKPFAFGEWKGKFLFGLPGNPVSALVTFLLLVRPALLHWQGAARTEPASFPARAGEPMENRSDRRHFVRARLDERGQAWLAGAQASHLLGSLAAADGLVDLAAGAVVEAGQPVGFLPLEVS